MKFTLANPDHRRALRAVIQATLAVALIGLLYWITDRVKTDAPEMMTMNPTFTWKDDSSEDRYALEVIDSHGASMWRDDQIPGAHGSDVSVTYAGPPLPAGLYQFRVVSYRKGDIPISATEDLRGVFLVP